MDDTPTDFQVLEMLLQERLGLLKAAFSEKQVAQMKVVTLEEQCNALSRALNFARKQPEGQTWE